MVYDCPMGWGLGWGGFGWIFHLLIYGVFFLIVWWLLKQSPGMFKKADSDAPLDILKRRLVKGEITKKEFEELKKELS